MGIPPAGAASLWLSNKRRQLAAAVNNEQDAFRGSSIAPPDLSQGYNAGFQNTLGTGSNFGFGHLDLPTLSLAPAGSAPPVEGPLFIGGGSTMATKKTAAGSPPAAPVSTGASAVSGWVWLVLIIAAVYFLD